MKEYYYHVIPADTSSPKIAITQEQLYEMELKLSQEVCNNYRAGNFSLKAQRKAATLISISYHCLGGNDPCHLSTKSHSKKRSILLPMQYRFDYLSYFIEELIKMMQKFDRNKGCWTQYVLWARGKGLRRIIQQMKREQAHEQLIMDINQAIEISGIFCYLDDDSAFSEEIDSEIEADKYEEFEENISCVDGNMATK